jgi:hypothetical protein
VNTQLLKLLVTVGTSLALGVSLGWWGKGKTITYPPSVIPYAPAIVTKTQTVTKIIPGKPGECPSVEVTAGSVIAPPQPAGVSHAAQAAYSLGLSAVPRMGVPDEWRVAGAVRLGNSPLMVTAGGSLRQKSIVPDIGLQVEF